MASKQIRTKPELIKALVKLGYDKAELEALTVSELKSYMAQEKEGKVGGVEETDEASGDTTDSKPAPSGKNEINIYNHKKGDAFVRTYSLAVHGKDFKKSADQFLQKFPHCFAK